MRCRSAFLLIVSGFLAAMALTEAEAAPPGLEGSWSGSGTVNSKSGSDRVQCRVRYTKSSSASYRFTSTCTTENGRYETNGLVSSSGGNRYTGSVSSPDYKGTTGKVVLLHHGNSLSVSVTGGQGSANISLSRR